MPNNDPELPSVADELAEALADYQAWRIEVADRLNDAKRWSESNNFRHCGDFAGGFQVLVCEHDLQHGVKAIPFTCHLRYCPDCEKRHSAELVAKYVPILKDIAERDERATWSLKKIVLTTPYSLYSETAAADFETAWEAFERWQQLMLKFLLKHELTDDEKRRDRVDYKLHDYGSLVSCEFGGKGRKLHFHLLAYMPWLDKFKSSELWQEASGGEASITYIAQVQYHDVDDQVREQVKYITKFTELPPELVLKLADVLDGARRVRTYGTVRGASALEPVPHICAICASKIAIMNVRQYFIACIERNIAPDEGVIALGRSIYLDLIPGFKAGEALSHLARDDPSESFGAAQLPGFAALEPPKTPFSYH